MAGADKTEACSNRDDTGARSLSGSHGLGALRCKDFKDVDKQRVKTPAATQPLELISPPGGQARSGPSDVKAQGSEQACLKPTIVPPQDFAASAKVILDKIDTAHKGYVTKAELAAAVQNPEFHGAEAYTLAVLWERFDHLSHLGGVESKPDERISPGALDELNDWRNKDPKVSGLLLSLAKTFSRREGNEPISPDAIREMLAPDSETPAGKEAIQQALRDYEALSKTSANGTVSALAFYDCYHHRWAANFPTSEGLSDAKNHVCSNRELFAGGENGGVTPDGIRQGTRLGNCFFLASLSSEAGADPKLLRDGIRDNHDGTYTVTFAGDKRISEMVKAPTEAEQYLFNHGSPYGLWASVYEKAYGAYHQRYFNRAELPQESISNGGFASDPLSLLTGASVKRYMFNGQRLPTDDVSVFQRFVEAGKQVIASLDSAHRGGVTRKQITAVLGQLSGEQAEVAKTLLQHFDEIREGDAPPQAAMTVRLTAADLDRRFSRESQSAERFAIKSWMGRHFERFDLDREGHHTGVISRIQLADLVKPNSGLPDTERTRLTDILAHYDEIKVARDGLTKEQILGFYSGPPSQVSHILSEAQLHAGMQAVVLGELARAFSGDRKMAVVAETAGLAFGGSEKEGFVGPHAYSVLDFKPDGASGGFITLRNPGAGQDGTPAGKITIPIAEFFDIFQNIQFVEH